MQYGVLCSPFPIFCFYLCEGVWAPYQSFFLLAAGSAALKAASQPSLFHAVLVIILVSGGEGATIDG